MSRLMSINYNFYSDFKLYWQPTQVNTSVMCSIIFLLVRKKIAAAFLTIEDII